MTEWILSSSILILVVIVLRTVLRGKISLRLQYALWGLVLLRLLIPVNFGNTSISVSNLTVSTEHPTIQTTVNPNTQFVPNSTHEDFEQELANQYDSLGIEVEVHVDGPVNRETILLDALPVIWAVGFISVAGWFLISNVRFRKQVLASRYPLDIQKNGLDVYVTGAIDTPCLFGLKKPAIYVTAPVADNATLLRHTLEHEATHYRHGDHIWAILRCLCLVIHWYNPLVWWAAFLSQRDSELACDEATIQHLGEGERAEYGRTLISMTCQKKATVLITATTMTTGKSGIKERIMLIAKKPKMALYTLLIVVLAASIAVGCTFTGPKDDPTENPNQLEESIIDYCMEREVIPTSRDDYHFIGSVDDYALVYYSGMGPYLTLYRYMTNDYQTVITDMAGGDFAINGGLSVNHLVDGDNHVYFGTISDYHRIPEDDSRIPLDWTHLVFWDAQGNQKIVNPGSEGYICVMDEPMVDFWVVVNGGDVPLKMEQYLNQGYSIHESDWFLSPQKNPPATIPAVETTEPTSPATEPPTTEMPDDAPLAEMGSWYKYPDNDKVCIAIQPTGIVKEGGEYLYIIPEDQATLLSYYLAAKASAHTYTQWDSSNQYSGWQIGYKGQWWQVTESGAMFSRDPETWDGICMDAEDAKDLYAFCDAVVQEAKIGEPFRPEDMVKIKSAALSINGEPIGPIITDPYALNKIEGWIANSREASSVACPFGANLMLELEGIDSPKSISIATDSCAAWMSNGTFYSFGEITNVGINGNEEFYSLFMTDIIHEKAQEGPEVMARYWVYTNWRMYANTYSIDETFALMDMFRDYIVANPTDWMVTVALTTSRGLDGAFAEYYAGVVAALFEADPATFSFACWQMIPEQDVKNAIDMLAFHWNITPEQVLQRIEDARKQN